MTRKRVIKTTDFANLQSVESITNQDWKDEVKSLEKATSEKITKVVPHATKLALAISASGNYYVITTPSYQPSLIAILKSVGITDSNIKVIKKSTTTTELSVEDIKKLLSK